MGEESGHELREGVSMKHSTRPSRALSRRVFLKQAAAAVSGTGVLSAWIQGCSSKSSIDLLIRGGEIYDGSGRPPFRADIAVVGDSIVSIGKLGNRRAKIEINAGHRAVAPGFIDVHDHSDLSLIANPRAESVIHQGITTLVSGQCGASPFPIPTESREEEKENAKKTYDVELDWTDLDGFFARLEARGIAPNYATLVGHGSIRAAVVGFVDRPPTANELERMKREVEINIRGGAFGMSTGLEYTPGSFAAPQEIEALCRVVARFGTVYATHMRDEGDRLIESLDESIAVARASGVRLQISHFKTAYRQNWRKLDEALARIESARREGIDVFCDRYPYVAASTGLSFFFPTWAREGRNEDFLARLKDPALDARLRSYVAEQERKLGSWENVVLSSIPSEKNRRFQGKNILAAAAELAKPAYDFIRDLLLEENGQVGMISFMMGEENLKRILAHPLVGVGCDGSAVAPYGILGQGKPHPRNYGTFPRVLGRYIRQGKILPAEEMIRKMTSVPAARFGFARRGLIKPGYRADLVVFNPETIEDRATWENPHQYPVGIDFVIVNGQVVVDHNESTGKLPGRILRKEV